MTVFCVLMGTNISALLQCEPRLSPFLNEQVTSNLAVVVIWLTSIFTSYSGYQLLYTKLPQTC